MTTPIVSRPVSRHQRFTWRSRAVPACASLPAGSSLAAGALLLAAGAAFAQTEPAPLTAADACEKAVVQAVERVRGAGARPVQFIGSRRVITEVSDIESAVRGEGRYRSPSGGSTVFSYSCVFDAKTRETSGVVLRDGAGGAAAQAAATAARDVTTPSPISSFDACETATVRSLKSKFPRAERIVFGSDTRRVAPAENARTEIEGEGAMARAPAMAAEKFSYRCVFDTASGRVVAVQTGD